ncbi:MAG: RNA polymerase sigma factor [Ignavibacteriaceae bacterium]|nr:RNA polymerase sigma factor [Ignavibacteriaceae bacterium]
MPDNSDFELVRKFLDGDESSFNRLINKYQQKIYWHARRMTGSHLDADEVVQEVLIVLYNKLKDFQFKSSLYTWIYRITSTRCINYLNKLKLRKFIYFDDINSAEIGVKEDIVNDIDIKDKIKKLDQFLQILPTKQREIFILRNIDGLSYEEIAEITGKSIGGLKSNYFHAINKISEMMKNEFEE